MTHINYTAADIANDTAVWSIKGSSFCGSLVALQKIFASPYNDEERVDVEAQDGREGYFECAKGTEPKFWLHDADAPEDLSAWTD